jgi:hypothetical protein
LLDIGCGEVVGGAGNFEAVELKGLKMSVENSSELLMKVAFEMLVRGFGMSKC